MESIFTQVSLGPNPEELSKKNALLRMNNSVINQQLKEVQGLHNFQIQEMKQQLEAENQYFYFIKK